MAVEREAFLDQVLRGYVENYDITRMDPAQDEHHLAAKADLHMSETGYVLMKKAQMWSADSDEYAYFFSVPVLTDKFVEEAIAFAYEEGMSRIDLNSSKHHMCTRIVALFFCDEAEDAAVSRVAACRLYKSFQFSLKGWMEFHTVAVVCGKETVTGNRYARQTAKFLESVLQPEPRKKSGFLSIFQKMPKE